MANGYDTLKGLLNASKTSTSTPTTATQSGYDTLKELLAKQKAAPKTSAAKADTTGYTALLTEINKPKMQATSKKSLFETFRESEQADKTAADAQAAKAPVLKADTLVQRLEQKQIEGGGEKTRAANLLTGSAKQYAGQFANVFPSLQTNNIDVQNTLAENARAQKQIEQYKSEIASNTLTAGQKKVREAQIFSLERDIKATSGLPAAEKQFQATKYDIGDKLTASGQQDIDEAKKGLGKIGRFAVDLGVAGTQLAGDIGLALLTGGSALVPMGIRSFGGGAQEARASGASEQMAAAYGLGNAALSVVTERLTNIAAPLQKVFGKGIIPTGKLESAVYSTIQKLAKTDTGKTVLTRLATAAMSAGGEAFEEVVQGAITPLLQKATYDKNATLDLNDIMYQALVAASLGGALGVVGGPSQANVAQAESTTPVQTAAEAAQVQTAPATPAEVQVAPAAPQTGAQAQVGDGSGVGAANVGFDPYTAAQNKYGTIAPGENPARIVDVPAQMNDQTKVQQSVRTVMEAAATPESRLQTIEDAVVGGKFDYTPDTNAEQITRATAKIERDGWSESLKNWTSKVRSGKISSDLSAEGAILLNNAGNANASGKEYVSLLVDYADLESRAGKTLQAARILKQLTPEGRLYAIQKSINGMVDAYEGKYDIKVDPTLIDAYRAATTDEGRDAVISDIQQNIADQLPSTALDKWTALRYMNMLGNLKTQVRNVVGNVGMALVSKTKNEVAAGLETLVSAATGGKFERTKSFVADPSLYKAAWSDFSNVQNEALGEGKYQDIGTSETARDIQNKRTIFKSNGTWGTEETSNRIGKAARKITDFGWGALEAYRKVTNWAMEHGDVVFSRATYADALSGYLKANGATAEQLTNGTVDATLLDKARVYAIKEAQEATFRDTNAFSSFISRIGRTQNTAKWARILSEGIMPFRKTPANILVRAEEYSPLGLINTTVKAIQAKSGGDVSGAEVINSLSKTLTGTGLFALGYALADAGLLRGKDSDDEKQAAFDDLTGHQEYSLELPDGTSITMDWLTPESIPVFMGVALNQAVAENGFQAKDVTSALSSVTDPMIKMSMLQGVNGSLDNIKYTKGNTLPQLIAYAALSYLTQGLTNTLGGQIERTAEGTRMTTFTDKTSNIPEFLQQAIGKASAKTPGLDYAQIPYIDAWGQTEKNGSALEQFLSPAYLSKVNVDKTETELQRLYDATGETVFPQAADKSFTLNSKTYALTADEYVKYATTKGQTAYKTITDIMARKEYKTLTDAQKAGLIKDSMTAANDTAKRAVLQMRGETYPIKNSKVFEATTSGFTVDEYLSYMAKINSYGGTSLTQDEVQYVIDNQLKLPKDKASKLWKIINSSWKTNPYK